MQDSPVNHLFEFSLINSGSYHGVLQRASSEQCPRKITSRGKNNTFELKITHWKANMNLVQQPKCMKEANVVTLNCSFYLEYYSNNFLFSITAKTMPIALPMQLKK